MCNNALNVSFTAIYIFNSLLMCAVNMLAVSYMYVIVLCHKSTVTASMILFPVMSVCMIISVMRAFIYKEMWLFVLNLYVFMLFIWISNCIKRESGSFGCLYKALSVMFNRTIT